jgi:hypothetical protein
MATPILSHPAQGIPTTHEEFIHAVREAGALRADVGVRNAIHNMKLVYGCLPPESEVTGNGRTQ